MKKNKIMLKYEEYRERHSIHDSIIKVAQNLNISEAKVRASLGFKEGQYNEQ